MQFHVVLNDTLDHSNILESFENKSDAVSFFNTLKCQEPDEYDDFIELIVDDGVDVYDTILEHNYRD